MSYSLGKIVVLVPETGMNDFVSKTLSMGLMPPVSLLSSIGSGETYVENEIINEWMPEGLFEEIQKDWFIEFVRTLTPAGLINKELIIEIDDILEKPKATREEELDSVIKKMIDRSDEISDKMDDEDTEMIEI
jgi:hypothetical protein